MKKITCVLVGDEKVGKTSILKRIFENTFLAIPSGRTIYDIYTAPLKIEDENVDLTILDIACTENYDHWRPEHYVKADLFILCFSLVDTKSFVNIKSKWYAEVRQHCKTAPIVVVGTKFDLKNDEKFLEEMKNKNQRPISYGKALRISQIIGASDYIECSAKTREKTDDILYKFAYAALLPPMTPSNCNCIA
ncbi:hypothetical protein PVAND_009215 [Polypedilum vanderplanki]|uniref:Uncharacterized protein n=1 Tax=Polypedilum vanderplanki TaxID=319348 RepID=A0A9J6CC08_POLVA|nr:hypothetical protein PVAND_009215 [Polypedilum vanderplanki]